MTTQRDLEHASDVEANRRTAIAMLDEAFNQKRPADAAAKYLGPIYIQHNPYAPDGADAFVAFATQYVRQFPDLHVDIKRTIVERDLVALHSHYTTSPS